MSCTVLAITAILTVYTALRPQLNSIYRYGEYKNCDRPWDDFKWCFSNNKLDDDEKLTKWIERRAEWWAQRRLTRSSEDVWDARDDTETLKEWPTEAVKDGTRLYN